MSELRRSRNDYVTSSRPHEQIIYTGTGDSVRALDIMTPLCISCRNRITGPCVALGYPYHGLVHQTCIPYFHFDGAWPHEFPMVHYRRNALQPRQSQDFQAGDEHRISQR